MEKKKYTVWIRNSETQELKARHRTACTADEAVDLVETGLEYPWKVARFETMNEGKCGYGGTASR